MLRARARASCSVSVNGAAVFCWGSVATFTCEIASCPNAHAMLTIPRTHMRRTIATRIPCEAKGEVLIPFSFPIVVEQRLREAEIELTVVRFSYACVMGVAVFFASPGSARFGGKVQRRGFPPTL